MQRRKRHWGNRKYKPARQSTPKPAASTSKLAWGMGADWPGDWPFKMKTGMVSIQVSWSELWSTKAFGKERERFCKGLTVLHFCLLSLKRFWVGKGWTQFHLLHVCLEDQAVNESKGWKLMNAQGLKSDECTRVESWDRQMPRGFAARPREKVRRVD